MKRDYPDRPIVGAGAVIVHAGRVLAVRRGTEPLKGEWSIPGGVVDVGETLRQAAAREAREETGLEVEPGEVLEVFDRILRDAEGKFQYHYVLVDFVCRVVGGQATAGSDVDELRWLSEEDLETFEMLEPATEVMRRALRSKS